MRPPPFLHQSRKGGIRARERPDAVRPAMVERSSCLKRGDRCRCHPCETRRMSGRRCLCVLRARSSTAALVGETRVELSHTLAPSATPLHIRPALSVPAAPPGQPPEAQPCAPLTPATPPPTPAFYRHSRAPGRPAGVGPPARIGIKALVAAFTPCPPSPARSSSAPPPSRDGQPVGCRRSQGSLRCLLELCATSSSDRGALRCATYPA